MEKGVTYDCMKGVLLWQLVWKRVWLAGQLSTCIFLTSIEVVAEDITRN